MRRGFLPVMVVIVLVFLFLMILPIIFAKLIPTFQWLLIAYFCIVVFLFVRRILGSGLLTYIISGLLIYIFVIRMWELFTALYMFYLLVNLGLSGIIIFGMPSGGVGKKAGVVR
jgi:hypothetical protein